MTRNSHGPFAGAVKNPTTGTTEAGLGRRLLAMGYDLLLVAAVTLLASTPFVLLTGGPPRAHSQAALLEPLYRGYLALVVAGFFVWFWTNGGQTLGQRAWRLRVVREDGEPVRPAQALLRLVLAWGSLGLTLLWVAVDREHRGGHDRLSGTRVILVPKTPSPPSARAREEHNADSEKERRRQQHPKQRR